MKTAKRLTAALLALAALGAFASTATAREYVVYSCKLPDGRPAPTDGWSAHGSAPYVWWSNSCASGGSIAAGLHGTSQPANTSNVGWGFDSGAAPIHSYKIQRAGRVSGWTSGVSMVLYSADAKNIPGNGYVVDYCAVFAGCNGTSGNLVRSVPQINDNSHGWFFTLGCGGYEGYSCPLASGASDFGQLQINSAEFTLEDDDLPSASGVSGSLTSAGASSGSIGFEAADATSGVQRGSIEVDGNEIVSAAAAPEDTRCNRIGLAGSVNDYVYRRPCPTRRQLELTLPASALSPGEHTLRVRVHDAAGNALTVFGPRKLSVAESTVKGAGASAARFVPDGSASMVASYGRIVRIAGTLETNTGDPISGASVALAMTSSAATRKRIVRTIHTDYDGHYALTVRATASRSIVLTHEDSGAALAGSLKVRSRITLRAAKRHLRALGKMRLTGKIPSERAKRGASVAIKVKSGRRWRTVSVVRTDRSGAFKFSYRFQRTRHARLIFRAVALKSSDLTVSPTPSKRLPIRVG